jgi:hypothetical protein
MCSTIVSMELSIRENLFSIAKYFSPPLSFPFPCEPFGPLPPWILCFYFFLLELFDVELPSVPTSPTACRLTLIIASIGSGVSAVATLTGVFDILPGFLTFAPCCRAPCVEDAFGRAILCSAAVNVAAARSARPLATSGSLERTRVRDAGPGPVLLAFFAGETVMFYLVFIVHGDVRLSSSAARITL